MKNLPNMAIVGILASQLAAPVYAVSDEELAQLRSEFAALAQRLSALEQENAQLRALSESAVEQASAGREELARVAERASAEHFSDRFKLQGDFRYRYEDIRIDGSDSRNRNRIRARAAIVAKLPKDVEVGLGVASGGEDPVSSNQTLGGGGSTKGLNLDLAYFKWNATEDLALVGGKIKNVWYTPMKSSLIWDSDFRPEGLGLTYKGKRFFAAGGGNYLESDSRRDNRQFSWGLQGGWAQPFGEASRFTVGAGYFETPTQGKSTFFGDADDFYGNSFACLDPDEPAGCFYLYDYEVVQLFADMSTSIGDLPLSFHLDVIQNQAVDDDNNGWTAGVQLGKAKAGRTWQVAYAYRDLEKDSTLGLVTDSDFAGGGTGGRGHIFKGAYGLSKKWNLSVTYFLNETREIDGQRLDFDRLMLDTNFKY